MATVQENGVVLSHKFLRLPRKNIHPGATPLLIHADFYKDAKKPFGMSAISGKEYKSPAHFHKDFMHFFDTYLAYFKEGSDHEALIKLRNVYNAAITAKYPDIETMQLNSKQAAPVQEDDESEEESEDSFFSTPSGSKRPAPAEAPQEAGKAATAKTSPSKRAKASSDAAPAEQQTPPAPRGPLKISLRMTRK